MILVKKITAVETHLIRKEVLRKRIDLPFSFDGDLEASTFHIGAFKNENLVGVVTVIKRETGLLLENQFQLRGMATLPHVRGEGIGKLLIKEVIDSLLPLNCAFLWCNAREVALPFYQKIGFKKIGEPFEVDLIGTHFMMGKKL